MTLDYNNIPYPDSSDFDTKDLGKVPQIKSALYNEDFYLTQRIQYIFDDRLIEFITWEDSQN